MKSLRFSILTTLILIVGTFNNAYSAGAAIGLNQVNTYVPYYIPNWLEAERPITFRLGVYNNSGFTFVSVRGFFEVYSTDGATWQPIEAAWNPAINWDSLFDASIISLEFSANGSGADTAHFDSYNLFGLGFPTQSGLIAWSITTELDASDVGKNICLDSVKSSHGISWMWALDIGGHQIPTWNGPHCFTIELDCCQNIRGDVNSDGIDGNILDLTFLIDRIFRGGPPAECALEADLNGDGVSANISDLSYLVDIVYRGGPPGVSCP